MRWEKSGLAVHQREAGDLVRRVEVPQLPQGLQGEPDHLSVLHIEADGLPSGLFLKGLVDVTIGVGDQGISPFLLLAVDQRVAIGGQHLRLGAAHLDVPGVVYPGTLVDSPVTTSRSGPPSPSTWV